ncbi:MAG: hypothetical protein ACP5QN_02895, partial [Minisyncoccia bacterium]
MENSEVQKLISIFLILAITISSAIFIFFDFSIFEINSLKTKEGDLNEYSDKYNYEDLTLNSSFNKNNSFSQSENNSLIYYPTISLNNDSDSTGNLTDDLLMYVSKEIIKANPNGPQKDENGNSFINKPNIENVSDILYEKMAKKSESIYQEIDQEINNIISKTNFITDDSEDSLSKYLNNFNNITDSELLSSNLLNKINSGDSPEIIAEASNQKISSVLEKINKNEVPEKLKNFHENFIKILVYQKNILKNVEEINEDPLKSLYFTNKIENDIFLALNTLQNEAENIKNELIQKNALNSNNKSVTYLILNKLNLFKINKANAFIVHDPGNAAINAITKASTWGTWLQMLLEWARKIATEILKDQLIHRLINQTINWIQGGGTPQFITNWKGFLSDVADQSLGYAAKQISKVTCPPFQPFIKKYFDDPLAKINDKINNTIIKKLPISTTNKSSTSTANSNEEEIITETANSNEEEIITESGTEWAKEWGDAWEETETTTTNSKTLNKTGSVTNSKPSATNPFSKTNGCTLGSMVNNLKQFSANFKNGGWTAFGKVLQPENNIFGALIQAQDAALEESSKSKEAEKTDAQSSQGFISQKICLKNNDGVCEKNSIRTPGNMINNMITNSIQSAPIGRIVNAQDITALVSALVNSAMLKLIKAGGKGLLGLITGGSNS